MADSPRPSVARGRSLLTEDPSGLDGSLAAGNLAARNLAARNIGELFDSEHARRLLQAELQEPQGDEDYSMWAMFRKNHGSFMDRRENYDPLLELRARAYPNVELQGESGSFDLLGYDVDIELPVMISTESWLTFGAYQYGRRYETSSNLGTRNNNTAFGDETLTAAGIHFGLGVFLSDDLLFEFQTSPGAYSDLERHTTRKDFDVPTSLLFTIRALDNLYFKLGARYNQVYEDAPYLPYLGLRWEFVDRVYLDILAPERMELGWNYQDASTLSLGIQVMGAQYHVHSGGGNFEDAQVQEVVTYLGLQHRLNDFLSFQARGGILVAGDYELRNGLRGYNASGQVGPSPYLELSLGVDF